MFILTANCGSFIMYSCNCLWHVLTLVTDELNGFIGVFLCMTIYAL